MNVNKLIIRFLIFFSAINLYGATKELNNISFNNAYYNDSLLTINQIKLKYKNYSLVFTKRHIYKNINNILLIFDNNKIDQQGELVCKRILLICNYKSGKYKIKFEHQNIIGCKNNYCFPDDSFVDIEVKKEYITIINQYCQSDGRIVEYITFKYFKKNKNYYLHKYGTVLYHRENPEIQTESEVLTTNFFGLIKLSDFTFDKIQK